MRLPWRNQKEKLLYRTAQGDTFPTALGYGKYLVEHNSLARDYSLAGTAAVGPLIDRAAEIQAATPIGEIAYFPFTGWARRMSEGTWIGCREDGGELPFAEGWGMCEIDRYEETR